MKLIRIDHEKGYNPCVTCYQRGGGYDPDSEHCQRCEFSIAVLLLKEVLIKSDCPCSLCVNSKSLGGGYWDCTIGENNGCRNYEEFTIDWKAVCKEYSLKEITPGVYVVEE